MSDRPLCGACKDGYRHIQHRGTHEWHHVKCACREDIPLTFVYQPELSGCVVASVAMLVGKSYFDVKQFVNITHDLSCDGMYHHQVESLLDHFGYALRHRTKWDGRLEQERTVWPCEPFADVHYCEVINTRGSGQHAVVLLRDGRVLDPWWGVLQGLHRYPRVESISGVYKVEDV